MIAAWRPCLAGCWPGPITRESSKYRKEDFKTPKSPGGGQRSHKSCDVRARDSAPTQGAEGPCARECGARKFLNAPADLQEPLKVADVVANASAEDSQLFSTA